MQQPDNDLHNRIASALTGLVKQIKALRYYPPGHPALQLAAHECLKGFLPLLQNDRHLSLTVRREGFLLNDQPVAKTLQVLNQLATFCFARRIQYLTVLSDLKAEDLLRFVQNLILDPQEIHARGGIQAVLEQARITTIWVNEQDLETILERRKKIEALPPETETTAAPGDKTSQLTPAQAQALDLERLLKRLDEETDDQRFRNHLQELIPLLRLNLIIENRALVLRAMVLLCRNATGQKFSEVRRAHALNALGQLATDELTDFLVAMLVDRECGEAARKALLNVLAFLGDKIVRRLMFLLAEETSATNRKVLADVLVRTGVAAVPVLQEHLFDDRWYVVRNAVAILGEIRSQDSLPHLTPLLEHKDIRVRREAVRSLTKIGGQRAVNILLKAAESDDQELSRQALLSLGAIRAASAIPTLIKLIEQPELSRGAVDIKKDAIRALGEIRSSEAVAPLLKILGRRSLLRRALNDELRAAAVAALGEIGDESVRTVLEKASGDRAPAVARAAVQALMLLDKDTP
ncbi:MAG: HEAT repeat domain-containing protein [Deltaproteobacteria bacterium]|nr:MAG: HEAT repeat domain-containing protein [Deltaproteobacteria bacterium]